MMSYRFKRRSFLASVGGAFAFETLLSNLEAQAEGAGSPARFLLTHFPIGTYKQSFLPTGSQNNFTLSPILAPFQSLMSDMIVLYGLTDKHLKCPNGGGHEAGTPFTTTCASAEGTRANDGEHDDGVAGGPSWDQIFLKRVPGMKQAGARITNTLADARVDDKETSTQCLSYDYATRSIDAANGGKITEHIPLIPELSPSKVFANIFGDLVPSNPGDPGTTDKVLKALKSRKSVLDFSLRELDRLKTLAPASERPKIEAHAAAIRDVELKLEKDIAAGGVSKADCAVPAPPDSSLKGQSGSKFNYGNEATSTSDEDTHEKIGRAHAAVLLAAFQCDLIRSATFQWSPGTNHVSFKGLYPANPTGSYMHHPMSHKIGSQGFFNGPPLTGTAADASLYQFLVAVNVWYNKKMADILTTFKNAKDAMGNSILDYTVIPYVTEVGDPSHERAPKASMIFGGKALGMKGGQFLNFESNPRKQVDVYLTCAQALLQNADPLSQLPAAEEKFDRTGAKPIDGLWAKPA